MYQGQIDPCIYSWIYVSFEHQPCLGGVHDTNHFYVECIVPVLPARSAKHQPCLGEVHDTSHLSVEC